jgi:hypothetical protein
VPAANLPSLVATARERAASEVEVLRKLDAGATTLDIYG